MKYWTANPGKELTIKWPALLLVILAIITAPQLAFAQPDTLWARTYGGRSWDYAYSVVQAADGGFIVAGETNSFGAGYTDVYLVRTDAYGDTLWTAVLGGTSYDWGHSVAQTADGGFIVAGLTQSFGAGETDVYLIRTDAAGDTLWTKTYGGTAYDNGCSVAQTADGGYIVAGYTRSFGAGRYDVYLIRIDAAGDTLWIKTYGGTISDFGNSVAQTSDGGYIVFGSTGSFAAGGSDVYLIRLTEVVPDVTLTLTPDATTVERGGCWDIRQKERTTPMTT